MIILCVPTQGTQRWEQQGVITYTKNFEKYIHMNVSFVVGLNRRSSCILFK